MDLRERCVEWGVGALSDAELVALILGTGAPGRPVVAVAAALLEDHGGGAAGLGQAEVATLAAVSGVGVARALRVVAGLELGRRSARPGRLVDGAIVGPEAAWRMVGPRLAGLAVEELHALFLDRRHRAIAHRVVSRGSDAYTVVDPRHIFRLAVGVGAAALVIAHNHPSGDPTPSAQDREVTRRVAQAGRVLGVPLLDHLVGAGDRYVSFAAMGELPGFVEGPPLAATGPGPWG
jgi:DNA repair protein RadC